MKLENWQVTYTKYYPPNFSHPHLYGNVYGHDTIVDGKDITTSRVVNVIGRKAYTSSGSVYELGTPSSAYVKWCKDNNLHIPTEEVPILLIDNITEEANDNRRR